VCTCHQDQFDKVGSATAPDLQLRKQELFELLMFHVNSVGGMGRKGNINLQAIVSEKASTAGDPWFGFLGFFDRRWRDFDYRLGRRTAHALLPEVLGVTEYEREPGALYEPDPAWPDFSKVSKADIDPAVRNRLREHVSRQVDRFIDQEPYRVNSAWKRFGIRAVAKWALKELMG